MFDVEFEILDELRDLIAPLLESERANLEVAIKEDGCLDPLKVYYDEDAKKNYLLDGHNRYAICKANNIEFHTMIMDGILNRQQAIEWMVKNQLARRNVSPMQASYLRGQRYLSEKQSQGGDRKSKGKTCTLVNVSEKLATEYSVSPRTIKNDAEFAEAVNALPQEEKAAVISGKSKLTKSKIVAAYRKQMGKDKPKPETEQTTPATTNERVDMSVNENASVNNNGEVIEHPIKKVAMKTHDFTDEQNEEAGEAASPQPTQATEQSATTPAQPVQTFAQLAQAPNQSVQAAEQTQAARTVSREKVKTDIRSLAAWMPEEYRIELDESEIRHVTNLACEAIYYFGLPDLMRQTPNLNRCLNQMKEVLCN